MSEWWSYRPSDFLLFSPRVYERLIESHNAALGPLVFVAAALAVALFALAARGGAAGGRVALGLCGAVLVASGSDFLLARYASINWAAGYAAPAFLAAGAGFAALALLDERPLLEKGRGRWPALAAIGVGTLAYPALAPLSGKPWDAVEIAGAFPDPTALVALGIAALMRRRAAAVLLGLVPLGWSLYAAMTLWTLDWRMASGAILLGAGLSAAAFVAPRPADK